MHLLILTVCFETPALFAVRTKSFPISCSSRRKLNQDFCRLLAFFPFVYRDFKNVKILQIHRIMFHRWRFLLFDDQRKLSRKQRTSVNRSRKRRIEKYYSLWRRDVSLLPFQGKFLEMNRAETKIDEKCREKVVKKVEHRVGLGAMAYRGKKGTSV